MFRCTEMGKGLDGKEYQYAYGYDSILLTYFVQIWDNPDEDPIVDKGDHCVRLYTTSDIVESLALFGLYASPRNINKARESKMDFLRSKLKG